MKSTSVIPTTDQQGQQGAFPLAAGSPLALRLADCICYELGVELNAARIQRELDASLGVLAARWAQIIADDDRVIANPEAERRAGVLEINRLRTVNSVRREMLAMLNTTVANIRDDARPLGAVASGAWLGKPSENLTKSTNTQNA
jgi:hypothetical protein